ncbi:MAG: chemotaxis protein CheW [Pseudomonadota bacterium]
MSNASELNLESGQVDEDMMQNPGNQYLTFTLANEGYGVNILRVEEIRGLDNWTRIPNSPPFVRGVVNIRGAIVPVIDLRERFELGGCEYSNDAVIIVLRGETNLGSRALGIVADAVSDVHDAERAAFGVTPEFGSGVNTEFISGLATVDGRMVMLLDVERILNHKDVCGADEKAAA